MEVEPIGPRPVQWEYGADALHGDVATLLRHLDAFGRQGWEAYFMEKVRVGFDPQCLTRIYFKRPRPS